MTTASTIKFLRKVGLTRISGTPTELKEAAKELATIDYGCTTDKVNWNAVVRAFQRRVA